MELHHQIQAVLFYHAEPLSVGRLAKLLKRSEGDIRDALHALEVLLSGTGLCLVRNGDEVLLGTAPDASSLIEALTKEELSKELSKAALETLAIVLYKGPISRSEIDYVRGVNSTFILRNLLIRGLVEKIENPEDQRSFLYKPTFQLLQFMGIARIEDLPNYEETINTLNAFVSKENEEPKGEEEQPVVSETVQPDEDEADVEADILEEDEAVGGYDDGALRGEHHRDGDNATETTV